jgi:molecular chaperone GrpE
MSKKEKQKEEMKQGNTKIEIERDDKLEEPDTTEKNIDEKVENEVEQTDDIQARIEQLSTENEQLRDQLLRKVAEFENYKRRTENESANFVKYAGEAVITRLLPVYDDLARSLEHADSKNSESLKKGIELVFEKFSRILKELGVERIEAKGKEFDVDYHEALMQKEVDGVPPHTVLEEIEPGYMYKDKVIRHSKVIVSQESSVTPEDKNVNEKDSNE